LVHVTLKEVGVNNRYYRRNYVNTTYKTAWRRPPD